MRSICQNSLLVHLLHFLFCLYSSLPGQVSSLAPQKWTRSDSATFHCRLGCTSKLTQTSSVYAVFLVVIYRHCSEKWSVGICHRRMRIREEVWQWKYDWIHQNVYNSNIANGPFNMYSWICTSVALKEHCAVFAAHTHTHRRTRHALQPYILQTITLSPTSAAQPWGMHIVLPLQNKHVMKCGNKVIM